MPGDRQRGKEIRAFALKHVEQNPRDLSTLVSEHFDVTPQAVRIHLKRLAAVGLITEQGSTRDRLYALRVLTDWRKTYEISPEVREHEILDADIFPWISELPNTVQSIWSTAFTEMFNNIIDHSAATTATVEFKKTAIYSEMTIHDNGVGIFKKIQAALELPDERSAIVELSKGKFTTDPSRHSGEGVFFTSKMFDRFEILSSGLLFSGTSDTAPPEVRDKFKDGTTVWMRLDNDSSRQPKDVYDKFTEEFAFTKTAVPIRLAQVGASGLVSRSQAKRILTGFDRFKVVSLDFEGVEWIGQGFADEIFRVYASTHPETKILIQGANPAVQAMIDHVKAPPHNVSRASDQGPEDQRKNSN
jgi:DNA-binding transcriptional ArsR family regulator/anti-sigma regulatory factor (Ser/Thr protein kinase)